MILTDEQVAEVVNEQGIYDCKLVVQHFAYKLLRDQVSPLGDIFCFEAPVMIGPLFVDRALVLAGELPDTNMFGAVCFQRLYATQLGSLLSVLTGKDYYVDDSCLFSDGVAQSSLVITNKVKDSVVFNMIFPVVMNQHAERFSMLDLGDLMADFKYNAIESFKHITKTVFVETRRDNF
jgi:hypothetical protein